MTDYQKENLIKLQKAIDPDYLAEAQTTSLTLPDESGIKRGRKRITFLLPLAAILSMLLCVGYVKLVKPLESNGQVHEVADKEAFDINSLYGEWAFDNYDAYLLLNEDNTYQMASSDHVYGTALPITVLEDCIVLSNEFGGESSVIYITNDGRIADAGGDTLHRTE